jgi:hypothetical protein
MAGSSLFKKLTNLFSAPKQQDSYEYWIFVRCDRCGEKISTRVDLRNDLSPEYGEEEKETIFYCRKVLMGQKLCFQQVEVHLKFSEKREPLDREISGGKFISDEEYLEREDQDA